MDAVGIAALITAITGAIATAIGGAIAAWKWAKTQAKADLLQEQSADTITAKNKEIRELESENARLWDLLTRPQEKT